jgi:hypothetical protein
LPVRVGDKSGEYTRKPVCRPGASRLPSAWSECDRRDIAIEEDQMNTRPLPTAVPRSAETGDRLPAGLAAPAALAAGVLLVITQLVQLATLDRDDLGATLNDPVYSVNAVVQFVVFWFLIVVLVTAHRWQARRAGTLGVVGLIAALIGTLNLAGNYWFEAFVTPFLVDALPGYLDVEPSGLLLLGGGSSYLLFAVGWLLFALACLRAKVFPTGISIALIVGAVLGVQLVQPPLGVPLGLALVWLGVWMLRAVPEGEGR